MRRASFRPWPLVLAALTLNFAACSYGVKTPPPADIPPSAEAPLPFDAVIPPSNGLYTANQALGQTLRAARLFESVNGETVPGVFAVQSAAPVERLTLAVKNSWSNSDNYLVPLGFPFCLPMFAGCLLDFIIPTDQNCTLSLNVDVLDAAGRAVTNYAGNYEADYVLGGPPPIGQDDESSDVPVDCRNAAIAQAARDMVARLMKDRPFFRKLSAPAPAGPSAAPAAAPSSGAPKPWWQQ